MTNCIPSRHERKERRSLMKIKDRKKMKREEKRIFDEDQTERREEKLDQQRERRGSLGMMWRDLKDEEM